MLTLSLAHLILVSMWGGLVVAEGILEFTGTTDSGRAFVAEAHYWIDLLAELPLLAGVLATGALLTARAWPPSPVLLAKIASALVAISINFACVAVVMVRRRHAGNPRATRRYGRWVRLAGTGVPFALFAAWVGLSLAG